MKLGVVVDGSAAFIGDLLADWQAHYSVSVFGIRNVRRLPFGRKWLGRALQHLTLRWWLMQADLVFFEWAGPLLVHASRLPRRGPLVVRLHSWDLFEFAPHVYWPGVDRVILSSRAMERRFLAFCPSLAGRTEVVFHGKRLDKFRPRPRIFGGVLGMLCRIVPVKRVYEVILALDELRRSGLNLRLRLGGPPGEGTEARRYSLALRELVANRKLESHVHFEGYVVAPAAFLSELDIFISNSYWEGQQNALIEAMACGCHALAHIWGGADEVLPVENLYTSERQLTERVADYCAMSQPEQNSARAAMRLLAEQRFDFKRTAVAMRNVLEQANTAGRTVGSLSAPADIMGQ